MEPYSEAEPDSADPFSDDALYGLIESLTGLKPVAFSATTRTLIAIAAALASRKQENRDFLSSSTLFLAAIEWGGARLAGPPPPPAAFRALADAVSDRDAYRQLRDTYLDPDYPEVSAALTSKMIALVELTSSVRALLEEAAKGNSRSAGGARPVPAVAIIADLVSGTQADAEEANAKLA